MPEISKLPKWAQKHIADLERELRYAQRHVEDLTKELKGDGEGLVTYSNGYLSDDRALPDKAIVEFTVQNAKGWNSGVRVMRRRDEFSQRIYLDINADRGVILHPRASNSVYIEPSD